MNVTTCKIILVVIGLSLLVVAFPKISLATAQTQPTFGVIAPCLNCTTQTSAQATRRVQDAVEETGMPTGVVPPSEVTARPCHSTDTASSQGDTAHRHKHHKGAVSNFMMQLLQLLLQLINALLSALGGQPISSPGPEPGPSASPQPTIMPCQITPSPTIPVPSVTVQPSTVQPSTAAARVLFEDDFNGPAGSLPDQSKWADYCTPFIFGSIKCGNDEKLDGEGHLTLPATATQGSGVVTDGKFSFDFGTVSAWIKLPKTAGYWPAFWMLNKTQGQPGLSGEIDVMEGYTLWPTITHFAVHAWNNGQVWGDGGECNSTIDLTAAFHKYTAKVEPTQITFYLDDKACSTGPNPITKTNRSVWPFAPDQPLKNYLMLDLAVGGAGGQQPTPSGPDAMVVDRVEVRSL
jgi:hypothetical protein